MRTIAVFAMSSICLLGLLCSGTAFAVEGDQRQIAFVVSSQGSARAAVVTGSKLDPVESTAVEKLLGGLEREAGTAIPRAAEIPPSDAAIVVVGTLENNPVLADVASRHDLPLNQLESEEYLLRTLEDQGRPVLIIAGGGGRGVLHGAQEALDQVITSNSAGDVYVTRADIRRKPAVGVRGTYSLTCWGLAPRYDRAGWEAAIDSMSAAGMNRIMFWMDGLFRSRRFPYTFLDKSYFTGVQLTDEDVRHLIRYAHDRGMEFLFGSGVFGWFTSGTFAAQFPEAADHNGHNLCPSHPLAQKLTLEYLEEMMEVFPEADGYMLEIRDEIRDCMCPTCQKPLDEFESKQFGQSELDLLEKLSAAVWTNHPRARFIWLIGYDNHPNDPMYYERIRRMGRDPRMEWLEVRGSWTLPAEGNQQKPLKYFSDRVYVWGGGYYAISPEGMQNLVQRILGAGLNGYLPAYEPGFGTACIYGRRIPYPVDLIPFVLTQFYYHAFTWQPDLTEAGLRERAHRRFFTAEIPLELADDLLFLRRFMQDHHVELTCIAPGLIRTNTLAEGVDQIWNDAQMPNKKAQLERLAQRVKSLQTLSEGGGDMKRIVEIEKRIQQHRSQASRRSAGSLELMRLCIDDIRAALAERHEDVDNAEQTLRRIEERIAEFLRANSRQSGPDSNSG